MSNGPTALKMSRSGWREAALGKVHVLFRSSSSWSLWKIWLVPCMAAASGFQKLKQASSQKPVVIPANRGKASDFNKYAHSRSVRWDFLGVRPWSWNKFSSCRHVVPSTWDNNFFLISRRRLAKRMSQDLIKGQIHFVLFYIAVLMKEQTFFTGH